MERRLGIMQSVEPVLENAIKTLQKNPKLVKKYTRKLSKIFIFTFLQKNIFKFSF